MAKPKRERPKKKDPTFVLARKNVTTVEGQLPLIPLPEGLTHFDEMQAAEAWDANALRTRIAQIAKESRENLDAVDRVQRLLQHGTQLPDIAKALGIKERVLATPRTRMWRIRAGSNMEIVAEMLEAAKNTGVSERQMVSELKRRGRLTSATDPRRAVHWTVTELRRRTGMVCATDDSKRWRVMCRLDVWKSSDTRKS
jgi:hypothetical protein